MSKPYYQDSAVTLSKNTKRPYYFGQELTVWDSPDTIFLSQWGMINYGAWCDKESARIRANGGIASVRREGNLCCIWREKGLDNGGIEID